MLLPAYRCRIQDLLNSAKKLECQIRPLCCIPTLFTQILFFGYKSLSPDLNARDTPLITFYLLIIRKDFYEYNDCGKTIPTRMATSQ
jgi:hypothetical protein